MSKGFQDPYLACPSHKQVVLPGENELQLDLDSEEDYAFLQTMLETVVGGKANWSERRVPSSTPGHSHVYLTFWPQNGGKPLSPEARIALQACLGSDRTRELLSILSLVLEMGYPPTVFYEPK